MSSRYNEIKKSYCNLYCAGSPLVLSAYALLQDTETHTVILQVKMKSVAKKEISAVILEIEARDIIEKPLKGIPEYQFLDLSVSRDAEFGTSSAIILPDATTRDVTISCSSVVFSDGTAWSSDPNTSWKSIPTEKPLSDIFDDPEVLDYFIAENGSDCCCEPALYPDLELWQCAAGHLNTTEEKECHCCGRPFFHLSVSDYVQRKKEYEEKNAAKAEVERLETEKRTQAQKARTKKCLRIGALSVFTAALIIMIVLSAVLWIPLKKAQSLYDAGEYEAALSAAEKIPGSNARQLSESCSARIEEIRLEKEAQEKAERETAVLDRAQAFYDEGLYPDAVEALQGFSSQPIDQLRDDCKKAIDAQFLSDLERAFVYRFKLANDDRSYKECVEAELDILEKYSEYSGLFYSSIIQQNAEKYIDGCRSELAGILPDDQTNEEYLKGNAARWEALYYLCENSDLFSDNEYFQAFTLVGHAFDEFNYGSSKARWDKASQCYTVPYTNSTPYTINTILEYSVYRENRLVFSGKTAVTMKPGETVNIPMEHLSDYLNARSASITTGWELSIGDCQFFDSNGSRLLPNEVSEA